MRTRIEIMLALISGKSFFSGDIESCEPLIYDLELLSSIPLREEFSDR
jgi:hypothetical protein